MKHNRQILTIFLALVFLATVASVSGQTVQPGPAAPEPQQGGGGGDPIRQLNLTPEQREQIRSIREHNREERAAINDRLRDTNGALDEALNAENPDEALIEQRIRDVAAAQASAMRIRVLTEIRIRRVLTLEQRNILRSLQQQAKASRRERLLNNPEERQRRQEERRSLQNQRNGLNPLNPRRIQQRPPQP